ncbi:MAG: protein kinase [Opitutae bacterium]|nr:protein kinase [Opitutae bacterium]|tara:strand:- start:7555 stop:8652 length:1098 start_codon:yes stop_codon:yes gene_type:complete
MIRNEKFPDPLDQEETDLLLPTAWKSGSLKYGELELLAEGGTAKVYLTDDNNLGRTVAYKTLHTDLQDSTVESQRFLREARVTANIQHPGTLPVYELGRDRAGQLFFTMKKVDGRDLSKILFDLKQEVPEIVDEFSLPRLLDILIQVCQTLAFAHDRGVIHRDLKPANIIIGKFGEVYVLDWGLAKVMGSTSIIDKDEYEDSEDKKTLQLTPVGRHYGTPLYMSPEIARGDDDLDSRSDVFSLGIILYEMLTLDSFMKGKDIVEIKKKLLEENYPLPREHSKKSEIPRDLEAVCLKALKRNKLERYSSVTNLISDLQKYRHGEEVSVYWYSGWEKLVRWNHKKAYWLIALLSALAGALINAYLGN